MHSGAETAPKLLSASFWASVRIHAARTVCPSLKRIIPQQKELPVMFRIPFRPEHGLRAALVLAVTVAVSSVTVRAEDAGVYQLKYKFQPGQFLYYEVENTMKIVTRFKEAKEDISNQSQAWKQLRVVSIDEQGHATLEPMVERVVMQATKDAEAPVNYDSARDPEPPFQFLEVKKTIGEVQARITVASNGDLKEVTPLVTNDPALKAAAEKKDPRLNFLVVMPAQPVKIGDSWKDRFPVEVTVGKNLQQEVILQRTYALSAVKGSVASIKLRTSVVTPVNDPQIEAQLIQRTLAGVIEFDLEKGLILLMNTKVDQSVIGAFGPESSMSAVTKSVEKLLPGRPDFQVAEKPGTKSK
jgi:hypothetical protein